MDSDEGFGQDPDRKVGGRVVGTPEGHTPSVKEGPVVFVQEGPEVRRGVVDYGRSKCGGFQEKDRGPGP